MAQTGILSKKQRLFVEALLSEVSVRGAAKVSGIGERTAWRWLSSHEEVRAAIIERQDSLLRAATLGLASDLGEARGVLRVLMRDGEAAAAKGAGVRCRAACAVLDAGLRFLELLSIAERVGALERRVGRCV